METKTIYYCDKCKKELLFYYVFDKKINIETDTLPDNPSKDIELCRECSDVFDYIITNNNIMDLIFNCDF
jgi:hypothetical protein